MAFESRVNSQQIEYFRRRLLTWRDELVPESGEMAYHPGQDASPVSTGQAANTTNSRISPQDREQKLIHKIDEALRCIEAGTYGVERA